MLTFSYVASSILATTAIVAHGMWPRVVIFQSNFKKKRRDKLLKLTRATYGKMLIIAGVISFGVTFFAEKSEALTAAQVILNLLIVFAHLFAARLTVRFIKDERVLKSKSAANSQ